MKNAKKSLKNQLQALEALAGLVPLGEDDARARNGGIGGLVAGRPIKLHRGSGGLVIRRGSGAIVIRRGSGAVAVRIGPGS